MTIETNHPKQKGEIAEAVVLAELLKLEFTVLLPHGDNQPYDLVVDLHGSFCRLQVRMAKLYTARGTIEFRTSRSGYNQGYCKTTYGPDEIDFFIAWNPDLDKVYVVPFDDAGVSMVTLRLDPTRNGQVKRTRLAVDYELQQCSFD